MDPAHWVVQNEQVDPASRQKDTGETQIEVAYALTPSQEQSCLQYGLALERLVD